jgi:hypothetical protein
LHEFRRDYSSKNPESRLIVEKMGMGYFRPGILIEKPLNFISAAGLGSFAGLRRRFRSFNMVCKASRSFHILQQWKE